MPDSTIDIYVNVLIDIARKAGKAILAVYKEPFEVEIKADNSPLTKADKASNEIILAGLKEHYPTVPFISEEAKQTAYAERKDWKYCWSIDPLDGTKEFIKKNGEFTVNIALLEDGNPIFGLIYVPAQNTIYHAQKAKGAYKIVAGDMPKKLMVSTIQKNEPVVIVASRSHLNQATVDFIEEQKDKYGLVDTVSAGSALKFCLVAEGKAHFYPRFAPTMEWDTAAGHIIATEAGATVTKVDGSPLTYNREDLLNPYFLVTAS